MEKRRIAIFLVYLICCEYCQSASAQVSLPLRLPKKPSLKRGDETLMDSLPLPTKDIIPSELFEKLPVDPDVLPVDALPIDLPTEIIPPEFLRQSLPDATSDDEHNLEDEHNFEDDHNLDHEHIPLNRTKRQAGCTVSPQVTVMVDKVLENCKRRMQNSYPIDNQQTGGVGLTGGTADGFKNFNRIGPVSCACFNNILRLFIEINYLAVVVTYTLALVERLLGGLLGGILGGLVPTLTKLLDGVVSLLVKILCLDVRVLLLVEQQLVPGAKCILIRFNVRRISRISILNIELTPVVEPLEGLLAPVLDLVLKLVMDDNLKPIFAEEFAKLNIPLEMVQLIK